MAEDEFTEFNEVERHLCALKLAAPSILSGYSQIWIKRRAHIVLTHEDLVSEEQIEAFDQQLQHSIRLTDFFREDLIQFSSEKRMTLAIDNMKGGAKEIGKVRKFLERGIHWHFKKLHIPASWLVFNKRAEKNEKVCEFVESIIHWCSKKLHIPAFLLGWTKGIASLHESLKERIVSLNDCYQLAWQLDMPFKETMITLRFLHHYFGVLMYFPDLPKLKDTIICDTQIIYNSSVTNLIIDTFKLGSVSKWASERFRETGQFSLQDIRRAITSGDYIPFNQLVKLLEHLNIIAPIVHDDSQTTPIQSSKVTYFMPCVLKNASSEELYIHSSLHLYLLASLMVHYFVPIGIFPAIIANLVSHNPLKLIEHDIKKNRVQFRYGRDRDTVTLIYRTKYFEIHIKREHTIVTPTHEVCCAVREIIESTLKAVSSHMNYAFSLYYQLSFECPAHPGEDHLCVVDSTEIIPHKMNCLKNGKNPQPVDMQSQHLVWFGKALTDSEGCTSGSNLQLEGGGCLSLVNIKTFFKKDFPADKAGELGTFLGINPGRIFTLESNNIGNADEMLSAILSEWLNNDDEKSWEKLADALRRLDHSLMADKIASGSTIPLGGLSRSRDASSPDSDAPKPKLRKLSPAADSADAREFSEDLSSEDLYRYLLFKNVPKRDCDIIKESCDRQGELLLQRSFQEFLIVIYLFSLALLLLLLAGDVETNPGPSQDSKPAFGELFTIPNLDMKWREIGLALSLDFNQLQLIESRSNKPGTRKREMFKLAVKQGITWKNLIQALCAIGERSIATNVCQIFDIPMNISRELSGDTEKDLVFPDSARAMTSDQLQHPQSFPSSVEYKTFLQFLDSVKSTAIQEPIMLANSVYSNGIITQEDLHQLRTISSSESKASKLVSLIKDTLLQNTFKFDSFISSLRSISVSSALADKVDSAYRFNLVVHRMKKVYEDSIDVNYLAAQLNSSKLISDETQFRGVSSGSITNMCSIILAELDSRGLGEAFLSLLEAYKNTRNIAYTLKESKPAVSKPTHSKTEGDHNRQKNSSDRMALPLSSELPLASIELEGDTVVKSADVRVISCSVEGDSDPYLSATSNNMSPESDSYRELETAQTIDHSEIVTKSARPFVFSNDFSDQESMEKKKELEGQSSSITLSKPSLHQDQWRGPKLKSEHEEKFMATVKNRDFSQVEGLLAKEPLMVDILFEKHRTALMLASIDGNKEMVLVLLKYKASVIARDIKGCTALYHAASNGNYEVVKVLVAQPLTEVNVKNKVGVPILIDPALKGFSMVTEYLLEHGAKVNMESEADGLTPLYAATMQGQRDVIHVLLEFHADVLKVYNKTMRTPLEEAIEGDDPEIVKMLMRAVSKANEKSRKLFSVETAEAVKALVLKGARVDTRDGTNVTPIMIHVKQARTDVVRTLIHLKANVDLQDDNGDSALILASKQGHLEMVQILIVAGAILDLKEKENGYTALMFSITSGHVSIVKALVLAKANLSLRNRDGKSAFDLARDSNNSSIQEIFRTHNTDSLSKDPFVQLLSGYMATKTTQSKKQESSIKSIKNSNPVKEGFKGALKAVVPKSSTTPDESISVTSELKKCYKRIADLETRVHDLTIMGTMEIADENDVSYMERNRLESEFKKLKEAKKKAEQYSVEAKQTAQRLSAENFKLREEFNRERHFNELTHKNIMREVEMNFEKVKKESTMKVKSDVIEEVTARKAYEMIQENPDKGLVYKQVDFNVRQIKDIIMTQSVRVRLFHIVISGLPESGRSTLLKSMLKIDDLSPIKSASGIDLYEAIINQNLLYNTHTWMQTSKLQAEVQLTITALMYFFVKQHQLPRFDTKHLEDEAVFDDPEVQKYFETAYECLRQVVIRFESDKDFENVLTGSLSFINIYDIGVSKTVYEFLMACDGRNKNLLVVSCLNLFKYTQDSLKKPLNLTDDQYHGSQNQLHDALHHLVSRIEASSMHNELTNVVLVGTHADQFMSEKDIKKREREIMEVIKSYASDIGVRLSAFRPEMVTINAKDEKQCEKVKEVLIELLALNKSSFEIDVPVSFIFLRWVLYCTKKMFISREELITYARKSGIDEESKVDDFLEIFRNCGSIVSSPVSSEFLYKYVILLPIEFLHDLDKLYNIHRDESIPTEMRERAKYGILSEDVVRSLWQGSEGTMTLSNFYVSVLINVELMMKLEDKYFVPSLRLRYDTEIPSTESSSLIITSNFSLIPYRKQRDFVKYFTTHFKETISFTDCPFYNAVTFKWKSKSEEVDFKVRFSRDHIELVLDNFAGIPESLTITLCSILKTACVETMNYMCKKLPTLRYKLAILCPKSHSSSLHFVPFDILETAVEKLHCSKCSEDISNFTNLVWVKSAYKGSIRSAVHEDDIINPENLLKICQKLSSFKAQNIKILAEKLDVWKDIEDQRNKPVEELLFHVLFNWHCKNPSATKQRLARIFKECEFLSEAMMLDSTLLRDEPQKKSTEFTSKEITYLADSWSFGWEELGKILGVNIDNVALKSNPVADILNEWMKQTSGDRRRQLAEKFSKEEYPNMSSLVFSLRSYL